MLIDNIAWAIPPGGKSDTRPFKIISSLDKLGYVSEDAEFYFHGKSSSDGKFKNSGLFGRKININGSGIAAVFSPVYDQRRINSCFKWVDIYDDWSLAPDINIVSRLLSSRTYRNLADLRGCDNTIITCNSYYMRGKLNNNAHVVPNGVDKSLSGISRVDCNDFKIFCLGHFFKGRTDYELLKSVLLGVDYDEFHFGGKVDDEILAVSKLATALGKVVIFHEWLRNEDIGMKFGPNCSIFIPNIVSDYTISQDLMKIYQSISLGYKVICPRLLWPSGIDKSYAFLIDFGADLGNVRDWAFSSKIDDAVRIEFCNSNSWDSRANSIVDIFKENWG